MYREQIKQFDPTTVEEQIDKEIILDYLETIGDKVLTRESKIAHLTASGFIVNNKITKTLMVHHNLYDSWGWTGGHVDGDKDLLKVALKEAKEETGVKNFKTLSNNVATIEIISVPSHYKKGKYVNEHLHLNVTYILVASEDEDLHIKEDENSGVKWIDIDRLADEVSEEKMLPIYSKIIRKANNISKKNIK